MRRCSYTSGVPTDPIADLGARAKGASRVLATSSTEVKDAALLAAADLLLDRHAEILAGNADDVAAAEAAGTTATVVDRLRLTDARLQSMAAALRKVAALPDPVGEVADGWIRPNGLRVQRVRVPLGVVAIIYENRPNVTSDAFGLCLKSGNAAFLRGSSAAIRSNIAIASALREGLSKAGLPEDSLVLVEDTIYEAAVEFMRLRESIDVLIPRGGPSLIRSVLDNATVPYVIDGDGNCHIYVDASADLAAAAAIVENSKVQRPSVCNALETLLVHRNIAANFLTDLAPRLEGVELVGDQATQEILGDRVAALATDADYATEFLELKLAVRVVDTLDAAIAHISRYGTGHSEAIVTNDLKAADRFTREVDAAAVLRDRAAGHEPALLHPGHDVGEPGAGHPDLVGEHRHAHRVLGPMGLRELTTLKFVIHGSGHIRS